MTPDRIAYITGLFNRRHGKSHMILMALAALQAEQKRVNGRDVTLLIADELVDMPITPKEIIVNLEPPEQMKRLMEVIPEPELPKNMSPYAGKERRAKDWEQRTRKGRRK